MLNIASRRLLKWTALVLSLPPGVMGIEGALRSARAPASPPPFAYNPLTHKANGLPLRAFALAAPDEGPGPATAPDPGHRPSSPPEALASSILGSMDSDPIFVEPSDSDRLSLLHRMICRYNEADEIWMVRGVLAGRPEGTLEGMHRAKIPGAGELKAWLLGLPPRRRMELSPMFRERSRYLEVVRSSVARQKAAGRPSFHDPIGGTEVKMFREPSDVFISPNDGLPFLIGRTTAPFPDDAREHDRDVIVREQRGKTVLDRRFLDDRREVACVGLRGIVDCFHEAD